MRDLLATSESNFCGPQLCLCAHELVFDAAGGRHPARVRVLPAQVELWHQGVCVARHERSYARRQQILDLEHYLDILERKPGALAGSRPLARWREAGRWPQSYDRLWGALSERHGKSAGTRLMIELLQTGRRLGYARLTAAIETAVALNCMDAAAVRYLLNQVESPKQSLPALEIGALSRYQRPLPDLTPYNQLLMQSL
jgi:hypothetical protein